MARRRPGRVLLVFPLFGFDWQVRTVPDKHKILEGAVGHCFLNEHVMYVSEDCTDEQARTTIAHEIQHIIEEAADVDYTKVTDEATADRMTDQVSRGWLMLIRTCPDLLAYLRGVK